MTMDTEYVRLSKEEKSYGYKNLLHSQLEFLNTMRNFKNYRDLRSKEFTLKVNLKSKMGEVVAELEKLENLLPKIHFTEEHKKKEKTKKIVKEPEALMGEINAIKEKLYHLQQEV